MGSSQSRPSPENRPPSQVQDAKSSSSPNSTVVAKTTIALPSGPLPSASTSTTNAGTPRITKTRPVRTPVVEEPAVQVQTTTTSPTTPSVASISPSPPRSTFLTSINPTLRFGLYASGSGLLLGSMHGILRGKTPIITALATSIQWGLAGTTFHGIRSLSLESLAASREQEGSTRQQRYAATMTAGVVAGGVAGLMSARSVVVPGAVLFGALGLGGQWVVERREDRVRKGEVGERRSFLAWATTSKYSPLRLLSDEEYRDLLQERLLKADAEIAVLEDNIKLIRENARKSGDE